MTQSIARQLVYSVIDDEIEYAVNRWKASSREAGLPYREDSDKSVDEWLMFIRGYYDDAVRAASHEAGYGKALDVVRKLAALCVRCMETSGVVFRDVPDIYGSDTAKPGYLRSRVYKAIDYEREYQDALPSSRTDGRQKKVTGYLVMFDVYLRRAFDGWASASGDYVALDNIRKLAAIAVCCMEENGAPRREVTKTVQKLADVKESVQEAFDDFLSWFKPLTVGAHQAQAQVAAEALRVDLVEDDVDYIGADRLMRILYGV